MLKRVVFSVLFLLISVRAEAVAPTIDTSGVDNTGTTATSFDMTVAGTVNLIVVGVVQLDAAPAAVVGVTVEGAAATLVTGCTKTQGTVRTEMWYRLNPTTGAGVTIAADTSGTTTDATFLSAVSIIGADTSNPFGTCGTDGASDSTTTITGMTTTTNDLVVGFLGQAGSRTCSATAGDPVSTEIFEGNNGGNVSSCGYYEAGGASTTDMNVSWSGSANHADVAVPIHGSSGRRPIAPVLF